MTEFKNEFSKHIFQNKYALTQSETWHQRALTIVDSVCGTNGGQEHPLLSKEEREELAQAITKFKFMPGGRYIYYSGRPARFYNNCFSGDTKVLTEKGWIKLKEGVGKTYNILSPVQGEYLPATFYSHGIQKLNKITFATILGHQKHTWEVRATRTHHWLLADGKDTYDLRVGDIVPSSTYSILSNNTVKNILGFAHGFIFGDGSSNGQLRLCGEKDKQYLNTLSTIGTVTYPKSACGDPVLYFNQKIDWKNLPNKEASPEYIAAFITGWLAADGSETSRNKLCSINKEAIEWFREYAAYAGIVITGKLRSQIRDTKIGEHEYKNHEIFIQNYQYGDCFSGFKVISIEPDGEEEVFCPLEPRYNQIVIDHNIRTFNCYLLRAEEDTREEWADLTRRAMSCLMTGGGIGIDYSRLRESGRLLSRTGGIASGPIPLMYTINEVGRNVMQGGSRRSAIYASLNWKHPDVQEFLHAKNWQDIKIGGSGYTVRQAKMENFNFPAPLDMTNISVNYDNAWLNKEHREKDPIFLENCKQAMSTGEPGFSFNFGDKENETLRNACVPYETPILTDAGYVLIGDTIGKSINVWNGEEFSEVIPYATGKQELVKVVLSDGTDFICTPNHKFIDYSGNFIEASMLEEGTKLYKASYPILDLNKEYQGTYYEGYSQGFYSGDGNSGYEWSWVYNEKQAVIPWLIGTVIKREFRSIWKHGPMLDKAFVPVNKNKAYALGWLAGICDSDGTIVNNKNSKNIQIASIDISFLRNIKLMLSRFGCYAKITLAREEQYGDIKGKIYKQQPLYRLHIGATSLNTLIQCGLETKRLDISNNFPNRETHKFTYVISVEYLNESKDTFCFTEPKKHTGVFNGILTGQCTEVTSEDDSDVCNLGSINLGAIESLEEFKSIVCLASKFLVCGTIRAELPYDKVYKVREKNRRLGLGLMGIHEWLLKRGYKYEVVPELHKWLEVYRSESERAADEHCARLYISKPIAYRAIAPTGSIGILASTTTGIEPLFAVAYKRRYLTEGTKWKYEYVVDAVADSLIKQYGLQPDKIETALDLAEDYERRIRFQADVQDYVDMSISSTINLPEWGTDKNNENKVEKFAYVLAKYSSRLRGFTCYPDSARGGQPLSVISYEEANKHKGVIFEEHDICEIGGKSGVCGS